MSAIPESSAVGQGYTVQPYSPGDERGIVELFNEVFDDGSPRFTPRTLDAWAWEFGACPEGLQVMVAKDLDGTVIAHYATLPARMSVRGREVVVGQGVDSMVHPSWRRGLGRGSPFLATAAAYFETFGLADGNYAGYGFPNRLALRLGIAMLDYVPLFEPIRALYFNLFERRRLSIDGRRLDDVVEVERFGAEADELWRRWAPRYALAIVRDARYLNWRYADCPHPHRLFLLCRAGEPRGLFVLRADWMGEPILALVDYFGPPGDRELLATALEHAARTAAESRQTRVELWFPERSPLFRDARAIGFCAEPTALTFCVKLHREPARLAWHRDNWHYTIGDSDIF